jgi:signal transduction histidine kinase
LNNAVRHGRATEIRISFIKKSGQVRCEIRDNGCGFPNNPNIRGLGLNIMRYRASIIGATFDIQSERDKGTSIIVTLPADKKWRLNK